MAASLSLNLNLSVSAINLAMIYFVDWGSSRGFWVGGYLDDGKVWMWVTSGATPYAMSYTNWDNGQPSNSVERCLEVQTHNMLWNDLSCYVKLYPICERKAAVFDAMNQLIG